MKIAAYTPGLLEPSARARVRQFIRPLAEHGITVAEYPLPYGSTQPKHIILWPAWATATIASRFASLVAGRSADASWVCRQLLPAYLSIEHLVKKPLLLDVDDAIWLSRGGHRVPALARSAQAIVCGNRFLADKFSAWNPNVVVIPTAINTDFYEAGNAGGDSPDGVVIGWTGTSGNFPYLYTVEEALRKILDRHRDVRILIVADRAPVFTKLPQARIEFVHWSPSAEKIAMSRMSIGIMPLEDSEWARGKCSYKMLCYMAASLPVIVSPVGMNSEVLAQGDIGYGASCIDGWVETLTNLIEDRTLRITMGHAGRRLVESQYSLSTLVTRYANVLQSMLM